MLQIEYAHEPLFIRASGAQPGCQNMTIKVSEGRRFALLDRDHQTCEYSGKAPEAAVLRSGIYSPAELEELARMIREGQKKGEIPSPALGAFAIAGSLLDMIASVSDGAMVGMLT